MPTLIPTFLLKKLYVNGSFKNTATGFQLSLRNALVPGTLIGVGAIQIDGRDIPHDRIFITIGDAAPIRASEIALDSPRAFPLNATVTFRIEDQPLTPGKHRANIQVNTQEAGELKIDAEDSIDAYT